MMARNRFAIVTLAAPPHSDGMIIVSRQKVRQALWTEADDLITGRSCWALPAQGRAGYAVTRKVYYQNSEPFLYLCTYEIIENICWFLSPVLGTELL